MLSVTDAATRHLSDVLSQTEIPEDLEGQTVVARLVVEQQGLALTLSETQPSDTTFDHEGQTVLAIDNQVAEALDGKTLDVQTTEQGPRLSLT